MTRWQLYRFKRRCDWAIAYVSARGSVVSPMWTQRCTLPRGHEGAHKGEQSSWTAT